MERKLKLAVHDTYRDGGTLVCYEQSSPGKRYFIDRRIRTTTKDALYDKYPGDPEAKILDIDYILVWFNNCCTK